MEVEVAKIYSQCCGVIAKDIEETKEGKIIGRCALCQSICEVVEGNIQDLEYSYNW